MATVVLTAVGTILGGPIGGAIGAIIGQRIDQEIFKPKGRQGPRLSDLKVQTSSYGSPIPKLFGTMRVAGTVIWATDLREERKKSGGGKGRPSTTNYSYSVSFAVLLSARPIRGVKRIWADGNLLRGAAGDFKTPTEFRLYPGGEDQAADPLIASAEGIGNAPAYRGCAYAVFENFALGDYGNRIPSLTFEVEADEGQVAIGSIVDVIGGGAVRGTAAGTLGGFAASGDSIRGVIESLGVAAPLFLSDEGDALLLTDAPSSGAPIGVAELEASAGEAKRDRRRLAAALAAPAEVSVSYYEPARDYQAGLQRARRPGPGRKDENIELPAALMAGEAKAAAERLLVRAWIERETKSVRLPWRRIDLRPGQLVAIGGEAGAWRIARRTFERMVIELGLVRHRAASAGASVATPGRSTSAPDRVHGPTVLHLLDLPPLGDEPLSTPRLFVAAAGPSPGWRRAALLSSLDGVRWEPLGATAAPAVMGSAVAMLGAAGAALIDTRNSVEVQLLHDEMLLSDADDAGLVAGANLALLGDELIQFGRVVPVGGARWRLERLVRGRRGTEWAIGSHAAGERFVLIEEESLLPFDPPLSALGATARVLATGAGDPSGVEASAGIAGTAVRPPSPIALRAARRLDDGFDLSWTRRSRAGWSWIDGLDAPLGEEVERYVVGFVRGDGVVREVETPAPSLVYSAADVAADALSGTTVTVRVAQIGSAARSREAVLELDLS